MFAHSHAFVPKVLLSLLVRMLSVLAWSTWLRVHMSCILAALRNILRGYVLSCLVFLFVLFAITLKKRNFENFYIEKFVLVN